MNEIFRVNKRQLELIQKALSGKKNIYVAKVDGLQIQTVNTYCSCLEDAFKVPKTVHYQTYDGLQSCYEWMTYLYWLVEKGYKGFALIINNFQLMMMFHQKEKREALSFLEDCIRPIPMGKEYPDIALPFNVYLETPFCEKKHFTIKRTVEVYETIAG